jgi:hypothetical protein
MPTALPLSVFEWERPAEPHCFAVVHSDGSPLTAEEMQKEIPTVAKAYSTDDLLLVTRSDAAFEEYEPLTEETGLYRTFAYLEPTPAFCLAFASKYGPLSVLGAQESLCVWKMVIQQLQYMMRFYDAVSSWDWKYLTTFIYVVDDQVLYRKLPPSLPSRGGFITHWCFLPHINLPHDATEWRIPIPNWLDPTLHRRICLPQLALYFCGIVMKNAVQYISHFDIAWDPIASRLENQLTIEDLLGAICLQFVFALTGEKKYQKCSVCGRWFELLRGVNRANKLTCGQSCRTKAYRQRQDKAIELHAQGMKARDIAKELSAKLDAVKNWIANRNKER